MTPIYILSRGRSETATTPALLEAAGMSYTLMIEPQEFSQYRYAFPKADIVTLDKSHQGIAYADRAIQELSEAKNEEYYWRLDDNILSFRTRSENRNVKLAASGVLLPIEQYVFRHDNIGVAGPIFTWAFGYKKPLSINRQISSCLLIKNKTGCYFRRDVVEDTDFNMQILTKGLCTVRFNRLLIDKAPTGSMTGGCQDVEYANNGRAKNVQGLIAQWPNCFKMRYDNPSRTAPSQIWRSFKQVPHEK